MDLEAFARRLRNARTGAIRQTIDQRANLQNQLVARPERENPKVREIPRNPARREA